MPVYVKKTEDEMNAKLNLTRTAIGTLALLCAVPAMSRDAPKIRQEKIERRIEKRS